MSYNRLVPETVSDTRHETRVVPFRAGDGLELNLVHVRGEREGRGGG